uniref:Uncharacterized protein n=1 Tax=Strongyloides papillosus TaxID=174720 RepID=A0A0N5C7Y6_STREA
MVSEQEFTVILSFYHSSMTPSDDKKKPQEEEMKRNIECEQILEENMENSSSLLMSNSTTILKFHDFDNNSSKESKEGAPKLPSNPPPLINTEVKSTIKLLRETFEPKNIKNNQEGNKLENEKMSSAARLVQEATISEKRWSSQPERVVEGTPPKPVSFF